MWRKHFRYYLMLRWAPTSRNDFRLRGKIRSTAIPHTTASGRSGTCLTNLRARHWSKMPWTKLATTDELPPGSLIEVERDGAIYALCNVNGETRALSGVCPHQGGPLGEGVLNGETISCPWHMWEFNSGTGACTFNQNVSIAVFPVRVEGSEIMVEIA